jgi:hypothetical protein
MLAQAVGWTVLISAVVAALVALLIEYVAKPGLEARKERILADRRSMRNLRTALKLLLEHEVEGAFPRTPAEWTQEFADFQAEYIARAGAEGDAITELRLKCQNLLPEEIHRLLRYGLDGWKAMMAPPFDSNYEVKMRTDDFLMAGADITIEYLDMSWWHLWRRRELRQKAEAKYASRFDDPTSAMP